MLRKSMAATSASEAREPTSNETLGREKRTANRVFELKDQVHTLPPSLRFPATVPPFARRLLPRARHLHGVRSARAKTRRLNRNFGV